MSITIKRPEFVPDPDMGREEMEDIQREIADTAVFEDDFSFSASLEDTIVVGVDQAFMEEKVLSGVVAMDNGEVIEKAHSITETMFPYIPGLLSFREGQAIVEALTALTVDPDLLLLDGSGRIHFREAGIATHIGVVTGLPSIGVAKKLLCGRPEHSLDSKLEAERRVTILADSRVETAELQTVLGYAYQSKQYTGKRKVNPLYVSPGHRISAETAVDVVEKTGGSYKLPEPTRLADKYVGALKNADEGQNRLSDF